MAGDSYTLNARAIIELSYTEMQTLAIMGIGLLVFGTTGCCWDCIGNGGNEILTFEFSTDSLSGRGYRRAELLTTYVVRYSDAELSQPLDTLRQPTDLRLYWPQAQFYVRIAQQNPVPPIGQSFRVVVPAAGQMYEVTSPDVLVTENKCGCTEATLQSVLVDNQRREVVFSRPLLLEK